MKKLGSRWIVMSVVLCALAFYLAIRFEDVSAFTAIATVALGGGHFTNVMERRYPVSRDEDQD